MKTKILTIAALALLFMMACSKDDNNNSTGEDTPMKIRLTDNPGNYDEVNVHIIGIEIIREGGRMTLPTQQGIFNLLDYAGANDTILADTLVPTGRINQIRLILGDSNTVVVDGVSYPLQTPSAQQSGLKINVQSDIIPGVAYDWTLDFDAARSIVFTGNGNYILKPVIRLIKDAVSGSIVGAFAPASASGAAYAITGTDTFGAIPNSSGSFIISNLNTGTYDVWMQTATGFSDTIISGVSVINGQATDIGTIAF
jgi:hypothetical protein